MALTTLSSLTPPIKLNRGVCKPLCLLFTEANLRGAAVRCAMTVEPGTSKSRTFLLFFIFLFFPLPWLLRIGWVFPISSFLKRCCDSQGIQFTVVKAYVKSSSVSNKDNIKLDNNPETIWSKELRWLIVHVWIKGGLILTAHLSKPLKQPSWNCSLLPDNVDQSQITPAECKLVGDPHSLAESRKKVYNGEAKKRNARLVRLFPRSAVAPFIIIWQEEKMSNVGDFTDLH